MQPPCLHLPLDFEMRADLRMLAMKFKALSLPKVWAVATFARVWSDWGREGVEWRPIDGPFAGDGHDWSKETLTFIIEEMCGWAETGQPAGELMKACLSAGVMVMVRRGDLWGVMLNEFWRSNAHLDPNFISIQKRGGLVKAAKFQQKQVDEMAGQQTKILQGQLELPVEVAASADEQKRAIGLVMRMDRACGLPVRASSQYTADLVVAAVKVIRRYGSQQVSLVETYLQKNRDNPEVVKVPDRIVVDFDAYYKKAE